MNEIRCAHCGRYATLVEYLLTTNTLIFYHGEPPTKCEVCLEKIYRNVEELEVDKSPTHIRDLIQISI